MSNTSHSLVSHNNAPLRGLFSGRAPWFLGALVLAVLALAYIDGGEEPIRPIVQTVTLSEAETSQGMGESQ